MKTVLVFGANGRIGSAICKACQGRYEVIGVDVVETGEFYENNSQKISYKVCDVTNTQEIKLLLASLEKDNIQIDACVNTAYPHSRAWGKKFEELEIDDLTENLKLQLASAIILSQQLFQVFIKQGYGNFIHMSSIQGVATPKFEHYDGTQMTSPIEYSAIKSGIISMTSWLAKYYKNNNIRVNCISPGGILDKQPDSFLEKYRESCTSKGMLDAEDVVGSVLFLLSDQSKYINGQNLIVDDGWSL